MLRFSVVVLAACGSAPRVKPPPPLPNSGANPHRAQVAALIQPMIDAEIATGVVVGLYDAGKTEIYGFGKGPEGKPPTGTTLFEIGSVTKVYTSLLLADAVQRREVALDTTVSELLPPGVTAPTADRRVITLGELALHTSGLPRLPPSIAARPLSADPYAGYGEEALYADLVHTALADVPGTRVNFSNYGSGLLGFALGRKLGGGFQTALQLRVLTPLALESTYFSVPKLAQPRVIPGTDVDLKPAPPWTWDALAGAGALISTAVDQLALIDAELDAAAGSKQTLRAAMRLTQEAQLPAEAPANEGLGWQMDSAGRFWHNGGTGGYRAFVGFDPKTRRGIVVLASTSVSLVDHVADDLYKVLAGEAVTPPKYPTGEQVAQFAGTYQLGDFKLAVQIKGKRVYILGQGEQPFRLIPVSDHEMWLESQQTVVVFDKDHAVFAFGAQRLSAPRIGDGAGSGAGSGAR
jgi:CubicO group peptidase (beta-lactamase class C family)